jgi:hypothetical protein
MHATRAPRDRQGPGQAAAPRSHPASQPARFLGYDIIVRHCDTKLTSGYRRRVSTRAERPAAGKRRPDRVPRPN